jgi:hypothetical protein
MTVIIKNAIILNIIHTIFNLRKHFYCKVARIDGLWVYKAFLILFLNTLYCTLSKINIINSE